jgi:hypothetical protein
MNAIKIFGARFHGSTNFADAHVVMQNINGSKLITGFTKESLYFILFRNIADKSLRNATFLQNDLGGFFCGDCISINYADFGAQSGISDTGCSTNTPTRSGRTTARDKNDATSEVKW